jgi:hypothetical protein
MTQSEAGRASGQSPFFFWSLREASRLDARSLLDAALGRSHRAKIGKAKLKPRDRR